MGAYGASSSKSGVNTASTVMWNLWSTGGPSAQLHTLIVTIPVAPTTLPDLYVVRATVRGTQTTTQLGNALDPNDSAATFTLDSAWSTPPTVGAIGTSPFRLPLPLSAGASFYWTADMLNALTIRTGAGIAIVNAAASGATTGTFVLSALWRE